ncbi:MAG: hypothetical protein NVSMB52_15770 [Chloroflexota bacterium]
MGNLGQFRFTSTFTTTVTARRLDTRTLNYDNIRAVSAILVRRLQNVPCVVLAYDTMKKPQRLLQTLLPGAEQEFR